MNIHEYQTKNLLSRYGIPVPPSVVISSKEEVVDAIKELGVEEGYIKIQVHAGGRGKGGGVKMGHNPQELMRLAEEMLGMQFVNEQTGPQGITVRQVLVMPSIAFQKEYYVAVIVDRSQEAPMLLASREGGMEIEEVVRSKPESLLKIPIQLNGKIRSYHLLEIAKFFGWEGDLKKEGSALIASLALAFIENDGSLLEINPLVLTKEGHLTALDAKFSVDDNALFRQPAIAQWYDPSQLTPNEVVAKEKGLAYVGLDGDIGCLVNGAGLAMATLDMIRSCGGAPANFLDIGGGATKEEIAHGFKTLLKDPSVKAIFVNIFGGIMDCGLLAEGIVEASQVEKLKVPLVVRLEGTNVERGRKILQDSGLNILTARAMNDGAQLAVNAAKGQ